MYDCSILWQSQIDCVDSLVLHERPNLQVLPHFSHRHSTSGSQFHFQNEGGEEDVAGIRSGHDTHWRCSSFEFPVKAFDFAGSSTWSGPMADEKAKLTEEQPKPPWSFRTVMTL